VKRYDMDTSADYCDMNEDKTGMWVMFDDVQAAIDAAVTAEREQWEYALRMAQHGLRGLEELANRATTRGQQEQR
jgi:hypothetical protein